MNGPTHRLAGAITAFFVSQADTQTNTSILHHPAAATIMGALLGTLPDIVEPALCNPNHRQFFHSVTFFIGLSIALKKIYLWEPKDDFEGLLRCALLITGGAYLSHLVLDAFTKRSLPLVGKL